MYLAMLSSGIQPSSSLKTIIVAGEACDQNLVKQHQSDKHWQHSRLFNEYGPTEACVWSSYYDCTHHSGGVIPIGTTVPHAKLFVLDNELEPCPLGVTGELYVGGENLARGYLNAPELTAEKFISSPYDDSQRLYKTGDLVRCMADEEGLPGHLEFLGRVDNQVKIRGYRIELSDIESRLNQSPEIKDSVVIAQGDENNKQLIAFYLTGDTGANNNIKQPLNLDLRAYLQQSLPDYMLPAAFVSLDAIPLTPNGKVDRRALELMEVNLESSQAYLAPRNAMEEQLVAIWAEVLKLDPEKIGVNDNFFELGGHSLLATQVVSKIRSQLEIDVSVKVLFNVNTLAGVAEISQAIKTQHEKPSLDADLTNVEFEEVSL